VCRMSLDLSLPQVFVDSATKIFTALEQAEVGMDDQVSAARLPTPFCTYLECYLLSEKGLWMLQRSVKKPGSMDQP
jgi:hypothetical protein